jgi:hypothetical protein
MKIWKKEEQKRTEICRLSIFEAKSFFGREI